MAAIERASPELEEGQSAKDQCTDEGSTEVQDQIKASAEERSCDPSCEPTATSSHGGGGGGSGDVGGGKSSGGASPAPHKATDLMTSTQQKIVQTLEMEGHVSVWSTP